jgi:phosphoglycerate dehydrogenase-like enzyme
MNVLTYDRFVAVGDNDSMSEVPTLDELLASSDFFSLYARATLENQNLIDAAVLSAMKQGACLINTARETLVDEDGLDASLASGRLAGVVLDVLRPATPQGRHRLLRRENIV